MAKLIINNYTMPGKKGGIAVRKACAMILENPGHKQGDVLEYAANFAGINRGTATWLTSPGDKSPATLLWDRRPEGRGYHLYPNEFTEQGADGLVEAVKEDWLEHAHIFMQRGRNLKIEDLVRMDYNPRHGVRQNKPIEPGIFLGWALKSCYSPNVVAAGPSLDALIAHFQPWLTDSPKDFVPSVAILTAKGIEYDIHRDARPLNVEFSD